MRVQSAMEYLMTYGWSILIIAVVLGTLYSLGVFSSASLAPKASAGNCEVYKAAAEISLVGECGGEEPQFVAQFNGQSSYISLGQIPQEGATNSISYSVWFKELSSTTPYPAIFGDTGASTRNGYDLYVGGPGSGVSNYLVAERWTGGTNNFVYSIGGTLVVNTWYFAVITYNGNVLDVYLNGVFQNPGTTTGPVNVNSIMTLGAISGSGSDFGNYQISNFQIYNTTLSQAEITTLYHEGIGGAPVRPENIVGWWPLNGNPIDYSGNNDGGTPFFVTYSNSWTSGYTQP